MPDLMEIKYIEDYKKKKGHINIWNGRCKDELDNIVNDGDYKKVIKLDLSKLKLLELPNNIEDFVNLKEIYVKYNALNIEELKKLITLKNLKLISIPMNEEITQKKILECNDNEFLYFLKNKKIILEQHSLLLQWKIKDKIKPYLEELENNKLKLKQDKISIREEEKKKKLMENNLKIKKKIKKIKTKLITNNEEEINFGF